MYKVLEAELVLCGMTKKELSEITGIRYNTILAKFRGETEFTLDEVFSIKDALHSDKPIEVLFEKAQETA